MQPPTGSGAAQPAQPSAGRRLALAAPSHPHALTFSALLSNYVVGSLAVVIKNNANDTAVRNSVQRIFQDAGITKMVVQVERF